ncbi:MAG: hypothetical protein PGN23_00360 [Sphingomonas adhaesiva]|uniref:DUF6894 family protein n=1 Tax=Sphingomonas adhaesiva TaxID=28212 RepID=UPI002FF89677
MNEYFLRLAGPARDRVAIRAASLDDARNLAVQYLGTFLADHPAFADEGHWRLAVEDVSGRILVQVIVATVTPRG